jgi:hypothetical protein
MSGSSVIWPLFSPKLPVPLALVYWTDQPFTDAVVRRERGLPHGRREQVAFGYDLGAGLMIAAGLVEWVLGVEAAQRSLEDIATPLTTVEEAEDAAPAASREEAPAASGFLWGPSITDPTWAWSASRPQRVGSAVRAP